MRLRLGNRGSSRDPQKPLRPVRGDQELRVSLDQLLEVGALKGRGLDQVGQDPDQLELVRLDVVGDNYLGAVTTTILAG